MNKFILSTIILLLTASSFAAKTYNVTIIVHSLATQQRVEGFIVSTIINDVKKVVGRTNADGEFVVASIREKSLHVLVEDPLNKHQEHTYYCYNPKKVDKLEKIELRLEKGQESSFFKAVDSRYIDSTSVIYTDRSKLDDQDSADFIPASPVGGLAEIFRFLSRTARYPQSCMEEGIQGKVYLSFIIEADGTVTNVNIVKGVHSELDQEAYTVIRYLPKFNPATFKGVPVRSKASMPVMFKLGR